MSQLSTNVTLKGVSNFNLCGYDKVNLFTDAGLGNKVAIFFYSDVKPEPLGDDIKKSLPS